MQDLTPEGRRIVAELGQRYGVSEDAVQTLLRALVAGNGTMAQFSHPELGGMGQWSQGGMTMVGDMFNNALKARVDGLCSELSARLRDLTPPQGSYSSQSQSQGGFQGQSQGPGQWQSQGGSYGQGEGVSLFVPGGGSGHWWPEGLGQPSSTGAQNDIRYAWFPASRRLAVQIGGRTTVYDTGDHQIGGVSQQQGGGSSLTFTSQYGTVRVADLPIVSGGEAGGASSGAPAASARAEPQAAPASAGSEDILGKLERLGALKEKGLLSAEEFAAAKADLLRRMS